MNFGWLLPRPKKKEDSGTHFLKFDSRDCRAAQSHGINHGVRELNGTLEFAAQRTGVAGAQCYEVNGGPEALITQETEFRQESPCCAIH